MEYLSSLGPLINTYEENKKATSINVVIGLAALALVPVMIALFLGEKEISFNKFLFGFSAVFATVGGLSAIWSSLGNHGARVEIYEFGLTVEKRGERQTTHWDEITAVTEKVEKMYVNNQYIYDRYNYKIQIITGETFELSNLISNIDEIGRQIKEKTLENLRPQFVDQLADDEQIAFGSITMDKHSLGGIPWSELSSINLKDGVINIKDRTGTTVISGDYGATPNAHILMNLLKDKLQFE